MPPKKSLESSIGGIELSQVVKAAVVAIGAKSDSVNFESLRGLADTVGDDSLMKMFGISVAGKIELWKNGATPRYYDLYNQKEEVEAEISDRITGSISNLPVDKEVSRHLRLQVSRELSALSSGFFGLTEAIDIPKQPSSRKSKS